MELIKVVTIETAEQGLIESIKIWEVISKSPDNTKKDDVVESGYAGDCPLCEFFGNKINFDYDDCGGCLINYCLDKGEPFESWKMKSTAENAKRVLKQLEEKLEEMK